MKHCYLTAIILCVAVCSFAAPVITDSVNNGNWTTASTWDLNRVPQNGDTVLIPTGKTVVINTDVNTTSNILYIEVYGTLKLVGGGAKLRISSSSNVYVYVGGIITTDNNSSQIINIGSGTVFSGKSGVTIVGPQYANNTTGSGFLPFSPPTFIALPVKFIGFSVAQKNNDVLIQWSATEEENAYMYQLERSYDGNNWNTIAYVTPVGATSTIAEYSFTDRNGLAAKVYYRIKQVDQNGKFIYTSIKIINKQDIAANDVNIASTQNKVILQFAKEVKGNVAVRFVSLSGQVVKEQTLNTPVGQVILNSSATLHGNYIISISNGQGLNIAREVIL
jgi:hypothetical protein